MGRGERVRADDDADPDGKRNDECHEAQREARQGGSRSGRDWE